MFTRLSTAGGGRRWVQGERHDEAWFNVLGYCPDEFWQTEADALQEKTGHRVVFLLARPHGENSLLLLEDGSIWHWASSAMVRAEEA